MNAAVLFLWSTGALFLLKLVLTDAEFILVALWASYCSARLRNKVIHLKIMIVNDLKANHPDINSPISDIIPQYIELDQKHILTKPDQEDFVREVVAQRCVSAATFAELADTARTDIFAWSMTSGSIFWMSLIKAPEHALAIIELPDGRRCLNDDQFHMFLDKLIEEFLRDRRRQL